MTVTKVSGTIINVSAPKVFSIGKKVKSDYFHLTMKEQNGREILIYLSSVALGLYSETQSKIYFFDKKKKKMMKHRMVTPARLLNQKVIVNGELTLKHNGYYMNCLKSLVIV